MLKVIAILAALAGALFFPTTALSAFTVMHSFAGPEGETPAAPLVQGIDGLLYGVAAHGGDFSVLGPDGGGTVVRTDSSGNVTTLHAFNGLDGAVPTGIVSGSDGAFYGTTTYGGQLGVSALDPGTGVIYRIDAAGHLTMLFVFPGGERGYRPGPLTQGLDGALYGTAVGGSSLYARFPGIVYRFDPATGDYRILHTFVISDGRDPTGKLFQARDGFFYGTTNQGGPWNAGVVYKVNAAGDFAIVHPFNTNEGSEPKAGVFQASDGFFYGTLELGGYGGRIFRMDAAGNLKVLFSFGPYSTAGWRPATNPIEARDGFFYGTTARGGTSSSGSYGVVYRLSRSGSLWVLHSFAGPDGIAPSAPLFQASDGRLFGSTIVGGAAGLGTLFRVRTSDPALIPTLESLYADPPSVVGGSSATGTLTLSWAAPPGGAVVSLSTDSTLATVPATVTVPGGAQKVSFAIGTSVTRKVRVATIKSGYNGSQTSATLTITR
jgi:uncharacterized repeat protein (TIGR03803 family)